MNVSLPIIDTTTQRPEFARGPRSLDSVQLLRLSVTDRCNLRCIYCMPDDGLEFYDKKDALSAAEIEAVAAAAISVGVTHLKITGGEPTIRRDIVDITRRLSKLRPHDLSLTTNAMRLHTLARPLRDAGLDRITVSCDSLREDRFRQITHGGEIRYFSRGVEAAASAGFEKLKINVVVLAGVNEDEIGDFAALTLENPWTVRFIEYMPLGDSALTAGGESAIVDNQVLKQALRRRFGDLVPFDRRREVGVGPAQIFGLPGAVGRVGFISAMSKPFCETCNRLRLTSIGELRSCLFDGGEVSVLSALRPRPDREALVEHMRRCVSLKPEMHSGRGNRAMSQLGG